MCLSSFKTWKFKSKKTVIFVWQFVEEYSIKSEIKVTKICYCKNVANSSNKRLKDWQLRMGFVTLVSVKRVKKMFSLRQNKIVIFSLIWSALLLNTISSTPSDQSLQEIQLKKHSGNKVFLTFLILWHLAFEEEFQ